MQDRFLIKDIHPYWGTSNYTFDNELAAIEKFNELIKKYYNSRIYLLDLEAETILRQRIEINED